MIDFLFRFILSLLPFVPVIIVVVLVCRAMTDLDSFNHPEEYKTKGACGERLVYLSLVNKYKVPAEQILRNVYIPTNNGTTEIDLLIVSKKGILVFECKNYSGNVYGDGTKQRWVQYLGGKKHYFLSPIIQNRNHVKRIKEYFSDIKDLPVIPFFATTTNSNWKLKNISREDHVLGWTNVHFDDVYNILPDSPIAAKNFQKIYCTLKKLERPDEEIRQAHIQNLQK